MKTERVTVGEGRLAVTLQVTTTDGNGLSGFLYGGELPHVGGSALSAPGPMLHGKQLSHSDEWVQTVPGHKDAEAAAQVAKRLCRATGEPVCVAAGIHIDDATPEELRQLGANIMAVADAFLEGYLPQ